MARILIFTGDGKGKTTAALGMAARALGHGMRVCLMQFVKADREVGEFGFFKRQPGLTLKQFGLGFLPRGHAAGESHRAAAAAGWREARAALAAGEHELYILDELCCALEHGLVAEEEVLRALAELPESAIVAITGRNASQRLCAAADTVTEMLCRKHAYDSGVPAQDGVER